MNPSLMAQGPLPAGMLRIHLGHQERYVWPVHLPGWLALGWRVAGPPTVGFSTAEPPPPIDATAGEPLEQDAAKPASTRSRRGRRRKEEALPVASADSGAGSDSDASGTELSEQEQDGESPGAGGIEPDPEPDTTAEVPVLPALPDDLFDDPLI